MGLFLSSNKRRGYVLRKGMTWASWLLKSKAPRLFFNSFFRLKTKKQPNSALLFFVEGNPPVIWRFTSYAHKGPLMPLQWRHMTAMASHFTGNYCCSTVSSGAHQRKHQSSASLAIVRWIRRWPVDSPHKWTRKMSPFHDAIMQKTFSWHMWRHHNYLLFQESKLSPWLACAENGGES